MMDDDYPNPQLFDAWYLTDEYEPKELAWPDEMADWNSRQKEWWGVQMACRSIFDHFAGARVIHRGDSPVWQGDLADRSWLVPGDLDIAWEGRSPIFEVKAYMPAVRLRRGLAPPCQGLDLPQVQIYLNEQERTGRPFFVLWVWPDAERRRITLRGERVDLLGPPPETSLNRRRNTKGAKMSYWYVDCLRSMSELVNEVTAWSGSPFQLELI